MRIVIGLCAVLFASVALASPSLVNVEFLHKTHVKNPVTVHVVEHPDIFSLRRAYRLYSGQPGYNVRGFSFIQRNGSCVIHIIDVEVAYQPETIGHEFTHCIYGAWHENNTPLSI